MTTSTGEKGSATHAGVCDFCGREADVVSSKQTICQKCAKDLQGLVRYALSVFEKDRWDCLHCGDPVHDTYMVTKELWASAGFTPRGLCHLSCLESRIGRKLMRSDFVEFPINDMIFWGWDRGAEEKR